MTGVPGQAYPRLLAFFHDRDSMCCCARVVGENSVHRCAEGRVTWKYPRLGGTVLARLVNWPVIRPTPVAGGVRDTCVLYAWSEVRTGDKEQLLQGSRPSILDLREHGHVEWRKMIHKARIDSNFPLLSKVPSHLGGDVFNGAVRGALGFLED